MPSPSEIMAWAVVYETVGGRKPVAKFLRGLSAQAHSKCVKYIAMLQEHGRLLPLSLSKSSGRTLGIARGVRR